MPGSFLLDTSVLIPYRAGDADVVAQVAAADEVLVPIVVVGELLYGARKSKNPNKGRAWIDALVSRTAVLDCDLATARVYAEIRNQLRAAGLPIPENDLWIAAVARQHDLTLAARDRHFDAVEGLKTAAW